MKVVEWKSFQLYIDRLRNSVTWLHLEGLMLCNELRQRHAVGLTHGHHWVGLLLLKWIPHQSSCSLLVLVIEAM